MGSNSNNWKVVFGIAVAIIILPILIYGFKFGSLILSTDFDTWVNFSTYLSPYLVAALTIILAYISWQSMELMKLKEKPVLTIEKRSKKKGGDEFLSIRNIGSGPALEIKLFVGIERNKAIDNNSFLMKHGITGHLDYIHKYCDFHYIVTEFALTHSELIFIDWQESVEKIAIVYTDTYGNQKTVVWNEDQSQYYNRDKFGIDKNGYKESKSIYQKNKSSSREYNQVFSLPEVGKKEPVGLVPMY